MGVTAYEYADSQRDFRLLRRLSSRFLDERLSRAWFHSGAEAAPAMARWGQQYNTERPHSSLRSRTPAQFAA